MKLSLDPDSLVVDSFDVPQAALVLDGPAPVAGDGRSRYCSLYETCATCFTDCPCA